MAVWRRRPELLVVAATSSSTPLARHPSLPHLQRGDLLSSSPPAPHPPLPPEQQLVVVVSSSSSSFPCTTSRGQRGGQAATVRGVGGGLPVTCNGLQVGMRCLVDLGFFYYFQKSLTRAITAYGTLVSWGLGAALGKWCAVSKVPFTLSPGLTAKAGFRSE